MPFEEIDSDLAANDSSPMAILSGLVHRPLCAGISLCVTTPPFEFVEEDLHKVIVRTFAITVDD